MASSLVLTGGAASTRTLKESISQTAHGFVVGDVLRWNTATNTYVKAQADTAVNAEVVGVVNVLEDVNTFQLTYSGYIEVPGVAGASYPVLFLSGSTAGELSATPPSFIGSVVKPVLTRSTNGSGHIVVNYLGTQIGGSSTVAVDEIQPVGTIAPYAGGTIPDTWLECNGASYAVSDYPELNDKIRNTTGDRVPIYGYVARLNIAGTGNITVGGYIQFKTSSAAWSTNTLYGSNADVTAVVITAEGSSNYLVQVLPNYSNSKFVFPNTVFAAGSLNNGAANTANYRFLNSNGTITTSITATVSAIAVIAFNTPDLRGRFAVGVNPAPVADGTGENDTAYNSALSTFALGEEGGSESIGSLVNVATWNATSAEPSVPSGSAVLKPPYLATKYIIKAKPYTRAAVIDGVDIPYSSLLVRDLRSRTVGGSNSDLVFLTNTSGDAGNGTERMRLSNAGYLGIGTTDSAYTTHTGSSIPKYPLEVVGQSAQGGVLECARFINTAASTSSVRILLGSNTNPSGGAATQASITAKTTSAGAGTLEFGTSGNTQRIVIAAAGDVGIANASPGATLDVNGTLKVGNFGGSTNVMPKPQHSTAGAVGHIMPYQTLVSTSGQTQVAQKGIPAGTWLINLVWVENSDIGAAPGDRDIQAIMCKVITVPAGQYFYIATNTEQANPPSGAGSTNPPPIYMKFATTDTITPPSSPNTLSSWTNATWYQVKTNAGIPEAEAKQEDGTYLSFYGYVENTTGILVGGQNTGIGPGYGYIQRLA
jgi:hypothetical protein